MMRVMLPQHLRTLARVGSEVQVDVAGEVTQRSLIDALEASYPMLGGTIRDYVTRERRPFFEILFEDAQEPSWEEAQSCIDTLARKQLERELSEVQRGIEANPSGQALKDLLTRKQELMRRLAASA